MNDNISDVDLKNNILTAFKVEPSVRNSDIDVLVKDGTVTLHGFSPSYWDKSSAVHAAKRVAGVNAINDDIQIKLPDSRIDKSV